MYDNFDDFGGIEIDPEVLAIMNESSETSFNYEERKPIQRKPQQPVIPQRTNEVAVATSSLDSEGQILNVGDKVVIGNDKAIGRIIRLGKNALINIPNEGEFEFPCSVLTLYKEKPMESMTGAFTSNTNVTSVRENRSNAYTTLAPQEKRKTTNDKFTSYTVESLMREHLQDGEDYNDVSNDDTYEMTERLQEYGGDGQIFDMGIN